MSFIIAITGPTGSGKSTVAKQIANSVSNCVNIDVDVVKHFIHSGFIYDDSPEGIAQWELLGANLGQLAANFKQADYNVVVNGYLNVPAWSKLQSFVSFDSRFLLSPDIQTIIERDASRSEDDTMGEKAVRTHNTFFSNDPYFDDFIKINSTGHAVQETVAIILDYVNAPTQTTVNDRGNGAQNLCQIVDDQDNVIGAKPRNEIDFKKDYFRSSGLWLTNSKGQVLIAQRSLSKDKDPGKWGPAVAGTLEVGETYESNAHKEAFEELGLTKLSLTTGLKMKVENPRRCFCQWFTATCDWPEDQFVLQTAEVRQVRWIDKEDFVADVRINPDKYLPTMSLIIDALYPEEQKTLE